MLNYNNFGNVCCWCKEEINTNTIELQGKNFIHTTCYEQINVNIARLFGELESLSININETRKNIQKESGIISCILRFFRLKYDTRYVLSNTLFIQTAAHRETKSKLNQWHFVRSEIWEVWPTYPPDWDQRRNDVLLHHGRTCAHCGRSRKIIDIHHKLPISQGGYHTYSNLIPLCRTCHENVHGRAFRK